MKQLPVLKNLPLADLESADILVFLKILISLLGFHF